MSKLVELNNIFIDLDKSYEKLKSSFNVDSKSRFLKKLCYDNSNNSIIPKLKLILKEESSKYSSDEKEIYSNLVLCLDSLHDYLASVDLSVEITSLNSLLFSAIISKKNESSNKLLTEESLINRFIYEDPIEELPSKLMFKKYGELRSFCKPYRKKMVCCKLVENFSSDFFVITSSTINSFATEIQTNKTDFFRKVVITMNLLKNSNFEVPRVLGFADKSLLDGSNLLGRKVTKDNDFPNLNIYKYKSSVIVIV